VFDKGIRFDERIGPRGKSYPMGSETEFNLRLARLGHAAVYVPQATVRHQIRPEQMTRTWLVGRAFREGRGEARLRPGKPMHVICHSAAHMFRALGSYVGATIRRNRALAIAMQLRRSRAAGRLYETIRMRFDWSG
jgi:hypothetical protein